MPPAEPAGDQRLLGRQIDHAPRPGRKDAVVVARRLGLGAVLPLHDLHGLGQGARLDPPLAQGQRMRAGSDRDQADVRDRPAVEVAEVGVFDGDAPGRALLAHVRRDARENLGEEQQPDVGVLAREVPGERHQRLGREHDVDDDVQRPLGAALQARHQLVERADALLHLGRGRHDRLAVRRQHGNPPRAIEQPKPELRLQPIDCLAHRRLHAPELARRRREAARLGHRPQRPELLDRHPFQHRTEDIPRDRGEVGMKGNSASAATQGRRCPTTHS